MKLMTMALVSAALLTAACSGNTMTGASGLGAGSTASTADAAATGDARNSEPTDAPTGFTFVWQGGGEANGLLSFFIAHTPVVNVTKSEYSFERFEVQPDGREGWTVLPSLFVHSPTKLQGRLPHGRYRARARSILATQGQGKWTGYIEQSWFPPVPVPEDEVESCDWDEEAPGFWTLVRRFRLRGRA